MTESNDIYDALNDITEHLSTMTREQRIAWFRRTEYPCKLDFNIDFGTTKILVRTKFKQDSTETVAEKAKRVLQK